MHEPSYLSTFPCLPHLSFSLSDPSLHVSVRVLMSPDCLCVRFLFNPPSLCLCLSLFFNTVKEKAEPPPARVRALLVRSVCSLRQMRPPFPQLRHPLERTLNNRQASSAGSLSLSLVSFLLSSIYRILSISESVSHCPPNSRAMYCMYPPHPSRHAAARLSIYVSISDTLALSVQRKVQDPPKPLNPRPPKPSSCFRV